MAGASGWGWGAADWQVQSYHEIGGLSSEALSHSRATLVKSNLEPQIARGENFE